MYRYCILAGHWHKQAQWRECMRFDKASAHGVDPTGSKKMSTLCGLPIAALVCSCPRACSGVLLLWSPSSRYPAAQLFIDPDPLIRFKQCPGCSALEVSHGDWPSLEQFQRRFSHSHSAPCCRFLSYDRKFRAHGSPRWLPASASEQVIAMQQGTWTRCVGRS
jgi:hypothetical protein